MNDHQPETHPAPEDTPTPDLTADPFEVLQRLQQENKTLKDQALYATAEAENVKKRTEREKAEAIKYALSGFARDLLSVADTFDRALSAKPEAEDAKVANFVTGVAMTAAELEKIFTKHGLTRVGVVGEVFDHNNHQAVGQVAADEGMTAGTVAGVLQVGYRLHDRLLRPAMVTIVASSVDTAA